MNQVFEILQIESDWPPLSPDGKIFYDDFYERMLRVSVNHVRLSCACIDHSPTARSIIPLDVNLLRLLQIDADEVPFLFLCDMESLDSESIMIDKLGLSQSVDGQYDMYVCIPCHKCLKIGQLPPEALTNHRGLGDQSPDFRPLQLRDLSWIDSIIFT